MDEIPPPLFEPSKKPSYRLFWAALLVPPAVALVTMAMSQNKMLTAPGIVLAMMNYLASAAGAIYCGIWLAFRFCKRESVRVLVALALIAGIGLMDLILTFIGCVSNSGMDMK